MKLLFCDDDCRFLDSFSKVVEEEFYKAKIVVDVKLCNNACELFDSLDDKSVDIIFLDIDMPEISGFDVATKLRASGSTAIIIFVSSFDNLVFNSFPYQPFWFLRKTALFQQELAEMISRLIVQIQLNARSLAIKVNGASIVLLLSEIYYIESDKHYLVLHTKKGEFRYKGNIGDLSEELASFYFVRCHVGYLVNCRYIGSITKKELSLTTNVMIPISRNRFQFTQDLLTAYLRSTQICG